MLAVPASAFALTAAVSNTDAAAAPAFTLQARVTPRLMNLGHHMTVTGVAPASEAGHWAILQRAANKHAHWHYVAGTSIARTGRFSFRMRPRQSGFLRVVDAATQAGAGAAAANWSASPAGTVASAPQAISVRAKFSVTNPSLNALGGQRVLVRGRLMPGRGGRQVRLIGQVGRRGWHTLARARTGAAGRFTLHFAADSGMQRRLRVVFAGDGANVGLSAPAGALTVYSESVASWYNDAGGTACGFHAGLGVANKSLPCGTKVRFRYGGRSVTATVDDRGPFVAGRTWDFNQNVAGALGFGGVGTVWATR